jgi:prepilin-type N-terminal cleavage/methylation domain-containing protein
MIVKGKKSAFTMMELLIVLGIIAILVAMLIPAVTMVRNMAKETQQKAQLTTIEMGITAFKNDYGDYPPSHGYNSSGNPDDYYCGAQTLAEALVGWDLLGFHPKSAWRKDGKDKNGGSDTYDPQGTRVRPDGTLETLYERKSPYLEVATANAFGLDDLFGNNIGSFDPNNFVICDVFGIKSLTIGSKAVKAGTPILYYRANTSSKIFDPSPSQPEKQIYNCDDNIELIRLGRVSDPAKSHKLLTTDGSSGSNGLFFYKPEYKIVDPKITTIQWPYRPDSYILISAGVDGEYGTSDDICNF